IVEPRGPVELRVDAPVNANLAPPGYYLLFIVNNGVPAVAKWIKVVPPASGGGTGGCPFVDTRTAAGWEVENSVLSRSLTNELASDAYRLKSTPAVLNGQYQLRLRENE